MNNSFVIFLSIVLIVAGSLFYDQILAIFRAMTPLEAMRQIVTFVLHVVVVTILGYVAITVNHIVRPWVRTFQQKQRQARGQKMDERRLVLPSRKQAGFPRGRKDQALLWMIQQLMRSRSSSNSSHAESINQGTDEKRIRLDF